MLVLLKNAILLPIVHLHHLHDLRNYDPIVSENQPQKINNFQLWNRKVAIRCGHLATIAARCPFGPLQIVNNAPRCGDTIKANWQPTSYDTYITHPLPERSFHRPLSIYAKHIEIDRSYSIKCQQFAAKFSISIAWPRKRATCCESFLWGTPAGFWLSMR